jgi:hypothetical protein
MPRVIRTITCASDDDWFASAQFEDRVTVWSLKERKRACDLDNTGYDFGGSRLCMLGGDESRVIVGSNERRSVRAYSATNGQVLWQRDGIQNLGGCMPLYGWNDVLVYDDSMIQRLDGRSGRVIDRFRGEKAFASLYSPLIAIDTRPHITMRSGSDNQMLWRKPLESFGILCAAFSPDAVLIAEPGGPLRAFSLEGKPLWSSPREPEWHTINLAWNTDLSSWIGVDMGYNIHNNPRLLVQWDRNGNILVKEPIGEAIESQLFPSGRYLVTSDGQLRSIPSLELVWRFDDDSHIV